MEYVECQMEYTTKDGKVWQWRNIVGRPELPRYKAKMKELGYRIRRIYRWKSRNTT